MKWFPISSNAHAHCMQSCIVIHSFRFFTSSPSLARLSCLFRQILQNNRFTMKLVPKHRSKLVLCFVFTVHNINIGRTRVNRWTGGKKLSIVWFHKTLKLSSVSPLTQPHWLFTISFVLAEVFLLCLLIAFPFMQNALNTTMMATTTSTTPNWTAKKKTAD